MENTSLNLDRFSRPLASERVHPFFMQDAIREQMELNKKNLVMDFISDYWEQYALVPDAETVQEILYHIDLDQDFINDVIKEF